MVKRANEQSQKHNCGLVRCTICQQYVDPENHKCYIQPAKKRKEKTHHTQLDENLLIHIQRVEQKQFVFRVLNGYGLDFKFKNICSLNETKKTHIEFERYL